jgi:hypothetical protein
MNRCRDSYLSFSGVHKLQQKPFEQLHRQATLSGENPHNQFSRKKGFEWHHPRLYKSSQSVKVDDLQFRVLYQHT